jgi:biofilm protein TabA
MIVGLLSDVSKHVLPAAIVRGIEALQQLDLSRIDAGRYKLEEDDLFYVVQNATHMPADEVVTESHFIYADVHIPVSASERFGFSLPEAGLAVTENLREDRDVAYYPTPTNECFIDIDPGAYIVFLPQELHRSCLVIKDRAEFRKVVLKVHSRLLGL